MKTKSPMIRHLSPFMAVLFLLAAVVQWNDPDPLPWITIYLLAALLSFFRWRGQLQPQIAPAVCVVSLGWALILLPSVLSNPPSLPDLIGKYAMKDRAVEEAREICGLVIIAVWTALITISDLKYKKTTSSTGLNDVH